MTEVSEALEAPVEAPLAGRPIRQLSLPGVIGVWAAATAPMAVGAWVLAPLIAAGSSSPMALTQALLVLLTAGMVWQFAMVAGLVFWEQRSLRWAVVREALWLKAPQNPKTGKRGGRMWWAVPIFFVAFALVSLLPFEIPPVAGRDFGDFLGSPEGQAMLSGSLPWLVLIFTFLVFNTVLGEELLFRGYLLPRMSGVFGKRDWIANGILFAVYHLHIPWTIPIALIDMFTLSLPSRRYRSALIGIIAHSGQSVVLLPLVVLLVLS